MTRVISPNYTQIPNIIFDYWMEHLTPAEFKILLCICRKTFGWKKERDQISLRQIEKMTGLSRKGIASSLEKLIECGLIEKFKSKTEWGDDAPNFYEVVVYLEGVPSELSTLPVVNSVHQGGSVLSTPTKEIPNTKENITKERKSALTSSNKNTKHGDHVELKEGEYDKLCKSIGKELTEHYIEAINNWVPNNQPKKDYAATIRSWYTRDKASGTLPKTQNLRSVAQASEGSMEKNKSICELVEKKLGHLFNERVFFQAGPSSGVLINTNKDIKKEFVYEKFEPADLKEILLREMEICFPGAQAVLLGTKKQNYSESLGEMISNLSDKFKTQD